VSDLEGRVKALEEVLQGITNVLLRAPTQQKPPTPTKFKDETVANTETQLNGYIVTKGYIHDRDLWAKINEDLKAHGYKWVSAGKDSHWQKEGP